MQFQYERFFHLILLRAQNCYLGTRSITFTLQGMSPQFTVGIYVHFICIHMEICVRSARS